MATTPATSPSAARDFWLPTIPFTIVEAINRVAAATGSMRYAMQAGHADYNGHHVTVQWNSYRRYWVAEYFWAGRVVLARGTLADCLQAAKDEYARGAKGTTVRVHLTDKRGEDFAMSLLADDVALAESMGFVAWSEAIEDAHLATWQDARYAEVNQAFTLERHGLGPAVGYLANSATIEEYKAKLEAWKAERLRERGAAR